MSEFLFRYSQPQINISGAKDRHIFEKRKKYLDFLSGWCIGNAGWNNRQILSAIKKFKGPIYVKPDDGYGRWEVLAKKLVGLLPSKNHTCFRATGGTEAVELSLKIARAHNRRNKFIAFEGAYHGQSFAALSLVGKHEKNFGPYGDNYIRLGHKDWENEEQKAVDAINTGQICAFISEPVICNLGVVVPPRKFFENIRKACTKNDTVFISDEVMTGFGRTGKWFGFEHYGIEPDVVCLAKGMSSGHGAIGAAVAKRNIAGKMDFDGSNYSSFGWHPLSVEASISNIDYIAKNKLVQKSAQSGKYLSEKLSKFSNPQGMGLCIGLDAKQNAANLCQKDGLIVADKGNGICLYPALDVSGKEMDFALKIIQKNI